MLPKSNLCQFGVAAFHRGPATPADLISATRPFHFTFRNLAGTPSSLQRFATQKVNSISFTGNNKKITLVTLNEDQKVLLMKTAACLITESKTLLKK